MSSYAPSSFRDRYVPASTNVDSFHQSDKNHCTGFSSARETTAARATAVFAVTFLLHLGLENISVPLEPILSYPSLRFTV